MFSVLYYDDRGSRFSVVKTVNEEAELKRLPSTFHIDRFRDDEQVSIRSLNEIFSFKRSKGRSTGQ